MAGAHGMDDPITQWLLRLASSALLICGGFFARQIKKIRDHDEMLRTHDKAMGDFADALKELRQNREACKVQHTEEEGKLHARIDALTERVDDKVDQIKDGFRDLAVRVERAVASRGLGGDGRCN